MKSNYGLKSYNLNFKVMFLNILLQNYITSVKYKFLGSYLFVFYSIYKLLEFRSNEQKLKNRYFWDLCTYRLYVS